MPSTLAHRTGDPAAAAVTDFMSSVAAESAETLAAGLKDDWHQCTTAQARIVIRLAEAARRETFREEGATSPEAWTAETLGTSGPTARAFSHVAAKSKDLPHLMGALSEGEISFDKVRTVLDVATPQTDQALCAQAKDLSVRELAEVARTTAARARSASVSQSRSEHDARYVRFNDANRTMTAQFPREDYAQAKASVDAFAKADSRQGENKIPLDQRRYDGLMQIMDSVAPDNTSPGKGTSGPSKEATTPSSPSPFFVVAHVPLEDLVDEAGDKSELAAELEHHGLIDVETVQRIACDAAVVVAVDDSLGHTMYEGRARRFPTGAQRREVIRRDRQCRFPGCSNSTFAAVHHIESWSLGGGTDLDNLVLLCKHHHGVVHRNGWSMTGNPNEELTIVGPTGRVTVSRPSILWTRVTSRTKAGTSP
jgi:Domain of unknown function (DUF222)/HNH endonuclease